jgi:predicted DNA-binding WGR domain protein
VSLADPALIISARIAETPLRVRWEKDSRYYEAHVEQDLWGEWVLTRIWGRRGTPMGQMRRVPCASYTDALEKLESLRKQRERRGYSAVGKFGNG